ncbi:Os04g0318300 [Oryza sativa Japonica Group]|uniref:Os04g0318300 protein n=1 Tax=Oryza sativa subsp. japonica TaxID=39947 RepID=A0A0P0W8I6_ORYSJ|nr:Os04g0318300 [Oryza sativa Japonica Group]
MAARSQTLQGLDILQNGVQNQEIDIPRNDQYVEEQNISNENWRTNCYEYLPNTVDESQWPTLVSYWYSKDSKKISDRNQENALKHPHTLGRKSFTRKRKELEVNEVEVDRETFFDECHKTKDGRYVTDATQEKMVLTGIPIVHIPRRKQFN